MLSFRYLKIWVGGAILAVLVVCGVAAPLIAPRDPQAQTLEDRCARRVGRKTACRLICSVPTIWAATC